MATVPLLIILIGFLRSVEGKLWCFFQFHLYFRPRFSLRSICLRTSSVYIQYQYIVNGTGNRITPYKCHWCVWNRNITVRVKFVVPNRKTGRHVENPQSSDFDDYFNKLKHLGRRLLFNWCLLIQIKRLCVKFLYFCSSTCIDWDRKCGKYLSV